MNGESVEGQDHRYVAQLLRTTDRVVSLTVARSLNEGSLLVSQFDWHYLMLCVDLILQRVRHWMMVFLI